MITAKQLSDLINEKLRDTELFLVEAVVRPGNRIAVFLDSDTHVSIGDCAEINRFIESKLDREKEDFELEVSSAGLDQPLKMRRQYLKNVGNSLNIVTKDEKSIAAALLGVGEKDITLFVPENKKKKTPKQEIVVTFNDIKEAKIIININK